MDDFKREIVKALIYISITGIPTFLITDSNNKADIKVKAEKVEQISSERERFRMESMNLAKKIKNLSHELNVKNNEVDRITYKYENLIEQYNILERKWKLMTSSNGASHPIETLDDNTYIRSYKTGDKIECHLLTKKLNLRFVRVTIRGPLIEIIGCENFVTKNTTKLNENGKELFLLSFSNPFELQFTCNSCEDGTDLEPSELEVIAIKLISFDLDSQSFEIMYSKKMLL